MAEAISKKCGVAISNGYTISGGLAIPYKAIDLWKTTTVYNPTGCIGTFKSN